MAQISVIIPVYNTSHYLEHCIESVINQTYKDLEIILVNDGSTDDSGSICDYYANQDPRIMAIHQQNMGVSAARNNGFQKAHGRFTIFIDSDDFMEPDMLEHMIKVQQDSNADVVICAVNYCSEDYSINHKAFKYNSVYDHDELVFAAFEIPPSIGGACWNKLFRTDCIRSIGFNTEIDYCEDLFYLFDALCNCNKGIQINKALYNVVEREGSVTRNGSKRIDSSFKIIKGMDLLTKHVSQKYPSAEKYAINKMMDFCIRYGIQIRKDSSIYKIPVTRKIYAIKLILLKYLLYSRTKKLISSHTFNSYVMSLLKL